jgi:ribonuclease HI
MSVPAFWQESVVSLTANADAYIDIPSEPGGIFWSVAMQQVTALYADGGVYRPRRCEAGSWAWVAADWRGRRVAYQRGWMGAQGVLRDGVTNNQAEFAAMLRALESVAEVVPGWSGFMCSDSEVTRGRFRDGWRLAGIPNSWVRRMHAVRDRLGDIEFLLLKGHPTQAELAEGKVAKGGRELLVSEHQVFCDALCTRTLNEWGAASGIPR